MDLEKGPGKQMVKSFDPHRGTQVATFQLRDWQPQVNQLEAKRFVDRMVGIVDTYFDCPNNTLYASYWWPCTAAGIANTLRISGYPSLEEATVTPVLLSVETSSTHEAVPA
jgi:hypothetical protein